MILRAEWLELIVNINMSNPAILVRFLILVFSLLLCLFRLFLLLIIYQVFACVRTAAVADFL